MNELLSNHAAFRVYKYSEMAYTDRNLPYIFIQSNKLAVAFDYKVGVRVTKYTQKLSHWGKYGMSERQNRYLTKALIYCCGAIGKGEGGGWAVCRVQLFTGLLKCLVISFAMYSLLIHFLKHVEEIFYAKSWI